MEKAALFTAGIVFLIVSTLHLLRLLFRIEVKIKNFIVPLWLSIVAYIVSLYLSIWMLSLAR